MLVEVVAQVTQRMALAVVVLPEARELAELDQTPRAELRFR